MGRRHSGALPQMRRHKPTNTARIVIDGKVHSLGRWGSDEAQMRYDTFIAAYVTSGHSSIDAARAVLGKPAPAGGQPSRLGADPLADIDTASCLGCEEMVHQALKPPGVPSPPTAGPTVAGRRFRFTFALPKCPEARTRRWLAIGDHLDVWVPLRIVAEQVNGRLCWVLVETQRLVAAAAADDQVRGCPGHVVKSFRMLG